MQAKLIARSAETRAPGNIMACTHVKDARVSSSEAFVEISRIPVVVQDHALLTNIIGTNVNSADSRNASKLA